MECENIPTWLNIKASTTEHRYLTVVNYTCADGFEFKDKEGIGDRNSTCTDKAQWNPPLSLCKCEYPQGMETVNHCLVGQMLC